MGLTRCFMLCLALLLGTAPEACASVASAVTEPAQFVDAYRVQLVGTVTLSGTAASAWFEYGLTAAYGAKTAVAACPSSTQLIVPVEGIKEQTTYHFRLVVKAGATTVHGADATFTTLTAFPAGIVEQPTKPYQLFKLGQTGAFVRIVGTGSSAKYQWLRNNVAIPGAVYETYLLPKITTAQAGVYVCRVTNPRRTINSDPAVIAVATVSPSTPQIVNESGSFSLTATVSPAAPGATYSWFSQQNPTLTNMGQVTGATAAKLTVSQVVANAAGAYYCTIVSQGETVNIGPVSVSVRLRPVIAPVAAQHLQTGQLTALQLFIANSPVTVTATGLPPGLSLNSNLRQITGRPTMGSSAPWHVTLGASNLAGKGSSVSFDIQVDPLDPLVRTTFNGLIDRQAGVAENNNLGGAVRNLVVTATGSYSGTFSLGASTLPFVGQLDTSPGSDPTSSLTLTRKLPLPNQVFLFTIDRATGKLHGTLQAAGSSAPAAVLAWGNPWSTTHPNNSLVGLHNLWMDPPTNLVSGSVPEGASTATATLQSTGSAALVFKMAEGSTFTAASTIGTSGAVPVHSLLHGGHGSVHGWTTFTAAATASDYNLASGTLSWNKTSAAGPTDHSYPTFDLGVTSPSNGLVLSGSAQRAVTGQILWGVDKTPNEPNGRITFSGGGLASSAFAGNLNSNFNLSTTYAVSIHGTNLAAETLVVDGVKGTFSGRFSLYDGTPPVIRTVSFQGLVAPGLSKGRGWFTLPRLPLGPASTVYSGSVQLNAAQ